MAKKLKTRPDTPSDHNCRELGYEAENKNVRCLACDRIIGKM